MARSSSRRVASISRCIASKTSPLRFGSSDTSTSPFSSRIQRCSSLLSSSMFLRGTFRTPSFPPHTAGQALSQRRQSVSFISQDLDAGTSPRANRAMCGDSISEPPERHANPQRPTHRLGIQATVEHISYYYIIDYDVEPGDQVPKRERGVGQAQRRSTGRGKRGSADHAGGRRRG